MSSGYPPYQANRAVLDSILVNRHILEQRRRAVAVLNISGMDKRAHQKAFRIDQNVRLLAFDLLSRIVAMRVVVFRAFHALAVDDGNGRAGLAMLARSDQLRGVSRTSRSARLKKWRIACSRACGSLSTMLFISLSRWNILMAPLKNA